VLASVIALRLYIDCGQAATIVGKPSKYLAQTSTNTFRLRSRGYDVRACRRRRRALLMCSNRSSVKPAVHEQREQVVRASSAAPALALPQPLEIAGRP
jgi:hypothetical protein